MYNAPRRHQSNISFTVIGMVILLLILSLLGLFSRTNQESSTQSPPTWTAPSENPRSATTTPLTAQKLRVANRSGFNLEHLVVRFPEDQIDFGDVLAGATSDYQIVPHGVYRYAAYDVMVDGQEYQQPVMDWMGESPMNGNAFTYTLDVDPLGWKTNGQVIFLSEVSEDPSIFAINPSEPPVVATAPTPARQNQELIATPENLINLGLNFKRLSLNDPQRTGLITKDQALTAAYQDEPNLKDALRFSTRLGIIQSDNQEGFKLARPVWLITFYGIESASSGPPGSAHYQSDEYTVVIDAQKGDYLFAFPLFDLTPQPKLTSGLISKSVAIDAASKIASSSQPEISGALVRPKNIQAEQLTLGEAEQRLHGNSSVPSGYSAEMTVWYITMDGLWASEAEAPGLTPAVTQIPYHSFRIILDAKTGLAIESFLQP